MNNEKVLIIAKRYAESLIEMSKTDNISSDTVSADLSNIMEILSSSVELYNMLINPLISIEDKENVIDSVFSKDVNKLIVNFLKILIQNNRFMLIQDIIKMYYQLLSEVNNIVNIEVTSAIDLNLDERNRIQQSLFAKLQKQINIEYKVSESIIAGLVIKMGDDVIDMSVAHKLEEYKKAII